MASARNHEVEIRRFIEYAPKAATYSELEAQLRERFGDRAWSRADIVKYCRRGRLTRRSPIETDPDLQSFIEERLWRLTLDELVIECRRRFGRTPSRTAISRHAHRVAARLDL
jgi:hypothetical protein